ncbi:hypothetical protein ACHAWF_013858 [Thalassiosira exigua]
MNRPMPYPTGAPMLTPAELQKFEAPLIALANLSGGDLRKMFYAFFSFLHRRTDFYCIIPNDASGGGGRMGFQEGQAEQILLASFRQFPLRKVGPKPRSGGGGGPAAKPNASATGKPKAPEILPSEKSPKDDTKLSAEAEDPTTEAKAEKKKPAAKDKPSVKTDRIRYTEEGKQIPVGNGGSTSRYVWTQSLDEVTVHVPLPEGIRAKDLDVKISANALSIRQKGRGNDIAPIEGTLFARVRPAESTWTLESITDSSQKMTTLQLILDKVQKTWWAAVISGDTPLIDTTMVDSTRHIGTYDEKTQAEIRRIMFDQRQERLGKPTSQQMALDDLPPLPDGQKLGGSQSLPSGVELITEEILEKASIG